MSSELEKLEAQRAGIQDKIWDIKLVETEKENQKYLGKCFRYENRYSSDESWWLYKKVISIKDGHLEVVAFQIDCYGSADVKRNNWSAGSIHNETEITEMDFSLAWDNFKDKVSQYEVELKLP